jgi:hypothetical protein
MPCIHQLTVSPSQPRGGDDHKWAGCFDARLGDWLVVERSRAGVSIHLCPHRRGYAAREPDNHGGNVAGCCLAHAMAAQHELAVPVHHGSEGC